MATKKVKKTVKVTINVLGKDLSQAEAEELYQELRRALNKKEPWPVVVDKYIPRPYQPYSHPPPYGTAGGQTYDNTTITCNNSADNNLKLVANGHTISGY